jgi:hypothetical protein
VTILYGRGEIALMGSVSVPDDRSQIIDYLLAKNGSARAKFLDQLKQDLIISIPDLVNESFEVYDELPLEIVYHKADLSGTGLSRIDFMLIIEELIREGSILAIMRGDSIIKL